MNKVDFIIVGQGMAGTLLAHELISANKKILIIDKKLPASSSRVAAGMINPVAMKRCSPVNSAEYYLQNAFTSIHLHPHRYVDRLNLDGNPVDRHICDSVRAIRFEPRIRPPRNAI